MLAIRLGGGEGEAMVCVCTSTLYMGGVSAP